MSHLKRALSIEILDENDSAESKKQKIEINYIVLDNEDTVNGLSVENLDQIHFNIIQSVFQDCDPDFIREKLSSYSANLDQRVENVINQIIDSKSYPKKTTVDDDPPFIVGDLNRDMLSSKKSEKSFLPKMNSSEEKKLFSDDTKSSIITLDGSNLDIVKNGETISKLDDIQVKKNDLIRLEPDNELNDIIVDFYLKLICKQLNAKCFAISSLLFNKFEEKTQKHIELWFVKHKIAERNPDIIFFPICKNDHWSLVVFDLLSATMNHLDSVFNSDPVLIKKLFKILNKAFESMKKIKIWTVDTYKILPKQVNNSIDCGVFLCLYAKCIALNKKNFDFKQSDINQARKIIKQEIVNSKIEQYILTKQD